MKISLLGGKEKVRMSFSRMDAHKRMYTCACTQGYFEAHILDPVLIPLQLMDARPRIKLKLPNPVCV